VSDESEINIFRALDFMRDNALALAKAKAERVYLEEFRKTQKALIMKLAEGDGHKTTAAQEREAYASGEYCSLLGSLKMAVETEEKLRWLMVAAQARVEVWRSIGANQRAEAKAL
jgi:hypothetical protein